MLFTVTYRRALIQRLSPSYSEGMTSVTHRGNATESNGVVDVLYAISHDLYTAEFIPHGCTALRMCD